MAFTETFGGTTIYPSDVSYRAISLSANQTLAWPLEVATSGNVVAQIMDVTPSASGFTITMPPANEASLGETALFFNAGSFNFTVADNAGNTIVTITPGLAYQVYLTTNTTVAGTWRTTQFGAGTSSATAGSLVGAGIKAINTTLNQSMAVTSLSVNYTAGSADRSAAFLWTGGAGTITLPAASTVGNDWFFHIRNGGTGAISLATTGGELINGTATVDFNPGDSAIIVCDGTGYFTIGFGQAPEFLFDYVSIDLTSQSSPYTLAGSNLNRIAYQFSGTLTTNMQIIVPATIQQYWVGNFTTGGSYTLTVKTSAGTGVVVPRDARAILYCNGTDVVTADTGGISIPILVSQGGTGATNASSARTNLGATSIGNALFTAVDEATARNAIIAAKSGANSDITSLTGLTTPLSVPQGGTGAATFTANGLIYGSGTSALGVTAVGTTGQVLVGNTGGAPSWATLSGIGVTSFSAGTTGLTPSAATSGAITLAGTLIVANGGTGATTLTGYVKGSGTSALTASATIPATDISGGAALTKTDDTNVTLTLGGTPASALLAATSLTLGWSGQLSVARGGTGASTLTANGVLYGSGTSAIAATAVGTTGQVLVGNTGAAPSWATLTGIGVTSFSGGTTGLTPNTATTGAITLAGTLGLANGGTGATTLSSGYLVKGNGTSAVSASVVYDDGTNVGIGTSSPGTKLDIVGAGNPTLTLRGSDGAYSGIVNIQAAGGGTSIINATGGSNVLGLYTNTVERMRIDSSGNVGIGTSSPGYKLDVSGTLRSTGVATLGTGATTTIATIGDSSTTNTRIIQFGRASAVTDIVNIQGINAGVGAADISLQFSGGNVGIGTTTPGSKLEVAGSVRTTQSTGGVFNMQYTTANAASRSWQINHDAVVYGDFSIQQSTTQTGGTYADRLYIDASGNVVVGATTPNGKLTIKNPSASGDQVIFNIQAATSTTSIGRVSYSQTDDTMRLFNESNFAGSALLFGVNNIERMRIDYSGNVGIGVTNPQQLLALGNSTDQVGAGVSGAVSTVYFGSPSSGSGGIKRIAYDRATGNMNFIGGTVASPSTQMTLDTSGNVGIGTTSPDSKLHVEGTGGLRIGFGGASINYYNADSHLFFNGALNAERMRIDTSGNVGIGTSSPANRLDVQTPVGTNVAINATKAGTDAIQIGVDTGPYINGGAFLGLRTGETERARITAAGGLLVGTTSSTGGIAGTAPRLVVEPPNTSSHGVILKSLGQSYDVGLIWNTAASGDNRFFEFGTDATYTARGSISYNRAGGLVAYNVTSDYRAKDIIGPVTGAGATIDALKVYEGVMKGATIARPMLIAHEAQEIVPYAVTGEKDAVNEDGTDKHQQMDHQSLIPLLIAEIQSLRARVAQLEGN